MATVPLTFTMSEADRAALVSAYCAEDGFTGTAPELFAHFKNKQIAEWRERVVAQRRREAEVSGLGEVT